MNNYPSNYIVFDIETTGLKPSDSKIIEIGALKYKNDLLVDTFDVLIDPEIKLPEIIKEITNITDEMLEGKEKIEKVLPKFLEFIEGYDLIGHNVNFDVSFIDYYARELNLKRPSNKKIDTVILAKKYIKDTKNHKLETLKKYLNLDYNSHRALDDCYTCNEVYRYCREATKWKVKTL